ncbi:MAG TPA: FecR domain-containing protein, partial [Steroidobacteraceae bacterium]
MTDPGMPFPVDIERDPAHVAAAEWFVRLQEESVSIEETLAWQRWLQESPDNARAFARIEEVSRALRMVAVPRVVPTERLAADRYDGSVSLKEWATHAPPRRWSWLAVALAAVCAGVAITTLFWRTPGRETYSTTVGENRHINLPDGSTVTLSGDTRISVAFSDKARLVELARGEALFVVAKDAIRPFKVRAGDATVIAVGTAFDVLRDSDRAIVSVTEGRVLVEPVADFIPISVLREFKPNLRTVRVDAGQQTTAGTAGIAVPSEVEDPAAATSWQT